MAIIEISVITLCISFSIAVFRAVSLFLQGSLHVSKFRIVLASILPLLIANNALKKRSLDFGGSIAAFLVGFVITMHNYAHMAAMIAFFYTSSKFSKFKQEKKRRVEIGGIQRTWKQVLCNGGPAVLFVLISFVFDQSRKLVVLGRENRLGVNNDDGQLDRSIWYDLAVLGSIACSAGDTWASEIGSAVGNEEPRLIWSLRRVPRGTNGAVSLVGIVASILGGATVGLAHYLGVTLLASISDIEPDRRRDACLLWFIAICALSGFLGSTIDSLLGSTLQYSGIDMDSQRIVEQPGPRVRHICGRAVLDNNSVNLLSSLATGLITPVLAQFILG